MIISLEFARKLKISCTESLRSQRKKASEEGKKFVRTIKYRKAEEDLSRRTRK
jgi:hypothetical protein